MPPLTRMPRPRSLGKARRVLLGSLALVLACGAYAYYTFRIARPIGSGPAGPPVPRAAFGGPWTDRTVLLLGLGDSITAGFGASPGHGYFDRLIANPPDESPDMRGICLNAVLPNLAVKNLAISGSTSIEHRRDQVDRLETAGPETLGLVVITTGGNDLIHNYGRTPPREGAMYGATMAQAGPWIDSFATRLDAMIGRIEAQFPGGCHIFLANIYDPTYGVGDIENAGLPPWRGGLDVLGAYNEALRRCAERHDSVHLVDIQATFLGHGIHCTQFWRATYRPGDPHYWYHENLEDPNNRGYDAIRRLFLREIATISDSISRKAPISSPR